MAGGNCHEFSLRAPGTERTSSIAQGSFRCCLNSASAQVPSGRTDHKRLDLGQIPLVIFPSRVSDRAVVEAMGQVVAVLVDAQPADSRAVRAHQVQVPEVSSSRGSWLHCRL